MSNEDRLVAIELAFIWFGLVILGCRVMAGPYRRRR